MFNFIKNLFGESANLQELYENGAVIIDVRTPAEFKSGHGKNAINIPLNTISSNIAKIKKYDKPVITCCRSGMRSGQAAGILKGEGVEAYNGGTWQSVNF